jgi:hypothetical protein
MALAVAAVAVLFPWGAAEGTMYVDSQERRSTMAGSFVLMGVMAGGIAMLSALLSRGSTRIEQDLEQASVVVPPLKQESNIVQVMINS